MTQLGLRDEEIKGVFRRLKELLKGVDQEKVKLLQSSSNHIVLFCPDSEVEHVLAKLVLYGISLRPYTLAFHYDSLRPDEFLEEKLGVE